MFFSLSAVDFQALFKQGSWVPEQAYSQPPDLSNPLVFQIEDSHYARISFTTFP